MGEGNLLSLRWNNHIKNFKFTLGQLLQRDLYSDATIACEGHFYPVHKFVLSTCSDYFANIFERTPCKHPVIVLKDVSSRDIEFLLSYMYGGEVSVGQADLPSLIRAAETLQIKGLVAPDDPPASPHATRAASSGSEKEEESSPKRPRLDNSASEENKENDIKMEVGELNTSISDTEAASENTSKGKNEQSTTIPFSSEDTTDQVSAAETDFYEGTNFSDIQVKQENQEEVPLADFLTSREGINYNSNQSHTSVTPTNSESSPWPSSFLSCSMSSNMNNSSISHQTNPLYPPRESSDVGEECHTLETTTKVTVGGGEGDSPPKPKDTVNPPDSYTNLTGVSYHPSSTHSFHCPLCDYVTHNRSWLYIHLRKHTGEKPYSCPYCSFRSAQKGNLNVHVKKLHASASVSEAMTRSSTLQQQSLPQLGPLQGHLLQQGGSHLTNHTWT